MATKKPKTNRRAPARATASFDGVYLFKLVLYLLLGSIWLKFEGGLGVPVGLIIGLAFTAHERFRIDRKIEYAVLLVAMFVGYLAPFGVYISF